jgi:hypothetical protein
METSSTPDGRMLHVDPASGEVTLKFKLPGFGGGISGGNKGRSHSYLEKSQDFFTVVCKKVVIYREALDGQQD